MAFTRRALLVGTAAAATATGLVSCFRHHSSWEFLTDDQARTLSAVCDQIIPADEFAGATEAGVLRFIDRQLIRHYAKYQQKYRDGLAQVERLSHNRFGADFAVLPAAQQLDVLVAIQHSNFEFFELVREHTMQGYYGAPRHGGNRDAVSWRMLGIDSVPLRGRAQYDLTQGKTS